MKRLAGLLVPAMLIVALYYATFGGEYSIFELRAARAAVTDEEAALGELEACIDSLTAWARSKVNNCMGGAHDQCASAFIVLRALAPAAAFRE